MFYTPCLSANLLFVDQLIENNCLVIFSHHGCIVQDLQTRKVIAKFGQLFLLLFDGPKNHSCFFSTSKSNIEVSNKMWCLWHIRLGHPNVQQLGKMLNSFMPFNKNSFPMPTKFSCEVM